MDKELDRLTRSVLSVSREDFVCLRQDKQVQEALDFIRKKGLGDKIIYFYVVDDDERMVGVLPTRRLLMEDLHRHLSDIMVTKVLALPDSATILDACEMFIMYKFLAFPIVDKDQKIIGIVDVGLLTDEAFDMAEREQTDTLFESIGFQIAQVRDASPLRAFRYRFPWLLSTIAGGTLCALLSSVFEATLAEILLLSFFLTLVLGLGESVSVQSMTITIQALRATRPTWDWYLRTLRKELGTAGLLGTACGFSVFLIILLWRGEAIAGFAIGLSIFLSICSACTLGLTIPSVLHALKLDPKIASGPLTLSLADICTILFYLSVATLLLQWDVAITGR